MYVWMLRVCKTAQMHKNPYMRLVRFHVFNLQIYCFGLHAGMLFTTPFQLLWLVLWGHYVMMLGVRT
jgi:hypothetical protein